MVVSRGRVLSALYEKGAFTFGDVLSLTYSPRDASKYIQRMAARDEILRVAKGAYLVVPFELRGKEFVPDRFLIGSVLFPEYYFSFHSALELHGVAYSSFSSVTLSVPRRENTVVYENTAYRPVHTKYFFGRQQMTRGQTRVWVSDREKTFLDTLDRLDLSGGLEEVLKSLAAFPSLNEQRIVEYLSRFGKKALYQRAGYVLFILRERWRLNDTLLDTLRTYVGKRVIYLDPTIDKGQGKFDRTWNLVVPQDIVRVLRGV